MPDKQSMKKLVVAISSSALFDLSESDKIYREQGLRAYANYQIAHEGQALAPGVAFPLVKKMLRLNELTARKEGISEDDAEKVEVILLSRNSADTGLRVFSSILHHNLAITRAAFTGGASPLSYMRPFGSHLFLSTNADDVREVLDAGMAAASILPSAKTSNNQDCINFAFDGDAVLFSDEAERVYQNSGLDAFKESEQQSANEPLMGGPFKPFLSALYKLQNEFPREQCPIRTALVTARSAPSHERVIKTLRSWNIRLDESLFLGGMKKRDFLEAYGADVFFDDQAEHCQHAREVVPTGHVVHGVSNEGAKGVIDLKKI